MVANCAKLQINYARKGMFTLSIVVSAGHVVAELRGSVRALMVFAQSMQLLDS